MHVVKVVVIHHAISDVFVETSNEPHSKSSGVNWTANSHTAVQLPESSDILLSRHFALFEVGQFCTCFSTVTGFDKAGKEQLRNQLRQASARQTVTSVRREC